MLRPYDGHGWSAGTGADAGRWVGRGEASAPGGTQAQILSRAHALPVRAAMGNETRCGAMRRV
jgi:hypothetical protein